MRNSLTTTLLPHSQYYGDNPNKTIQLIIILSFILITKITVNSHIFSFQSSLCIIENPGEVELIGQVTVTSACGDETPLPFLYRGK